MKPITVVSLKPFLKAAKVMGLLEADISLIEAEVAYAPNEGDLIEGSGGIRKRRIALPDRNKGKSGGGRLFTLYIGADRPAFIIALIDKAASENLTKKERNELATLVNDLKSNYRRKDDV